MALPDWVRVAGMAAALAVSGTGCRGQASAPGQFERELTVPAVSRPTSACAMLDSKAAGNAAGMTLWADNRPVAFAVTVNSPDESAGSPAKIANFHAAAGSTDFDLLMPPRRYSSVTLDLMSPGTVWRARVAVPGGAEIGRYTLFDLSNESGPISTTMDFAERGDRVLHVSLDRIVSRAALRGAWVLPSRTEETLFTTVATAAPKIQGDHTVADFLVARGVPVERVEFKIPDKREFRRHVTITAASQLPGSTPDAVAADIQQIHELRDGTELSVADLSLPAVLPDNAHSAMRVTVAVENGSRPPLPVHAVNLQMRQREICFTAWPGVRNWRLFYGSPTMQFTTLGGPPRSLVERKNPVAAHLGPETMATDFHPLAPPVSAPRRIFWFVLGILALASGLLAVFLRMARIPHRRR